LAWGIFALMRFFWLGFTLILGSLALSQTTSPNDLPPIQPKPVAPKPTVPAIPVTPTVRLEDSKTIQAIRARGRLIVALDPQFAPFALRDDKGKIVGFDADLAKSIAAQIGVPLEAQTTVFNGLLNAVKVGRADFAGSGLTLSSRKDVQYSQVFFDNAQIFAVRSGNPTKFTFEKSNLTGKQIGVRANTIGFLAAFRVLVPLGAKMKVYETNQKALAELQSGKIESLILDAPSFEAYRGRRIPIDRIAGTLVQEQYVFALPKNSDMLPFLNQAIETWKQNGTYYKSLEKWILDR
jgi:polar amino acid transport system substrate-binding protein